MGRLTRLLHPKSLAVIGGGTWGANVIRACAAMGFEGDIWPVHPSKSHIAGHEAYPDIRALPGVPDAAFIGVNRMATIDAVAALKDIGAGGATCFASGFAEAIAELADGANLQDQLLRAAGDMPVLGPNCYGILNYLDKVAIWPDQHGGEPAETGVAIVTQSSNIAINLTMQNRGVPLAYVVTAGNQAQTDMAQIGMELLRDPRVTALGLHVEGIRDINALYDLSQLSHGLEKPVVVLKIGASEAAQMASLSHTASLAGSAAGARALLNRLGFAATSNLPVFLELLKLWHVAGPLPHARIASASCSGGEACLVADTADGTPVTFPALEPAQSTALRSALGPKVALANPLDYHTYIWPDEDAMTATFSALMQADLALGLVILDFPRGDRCDASEWDIVVEAVHRTAQDTGKKMAIVSALSETLPEAICKALIAKGIAPLNGLDHAIDVIGLAIARTPQVAPPLLPKPPKTIGIVDEYTAKQALAQHGLDVPKGIRLTRAQADFDGLKSPLVLKGLGLAHKSEAGAVRLGLHHAPAVQDAINHMRFDAYLLEEMVQNSLFEMLIGVTLDPAHGYVLTLGAGGTHTELLNDTGHLLLPVTRADVTACLAKLRHAPILRGYRGAPPCDMDAIWRAIDAVQSYVLAQHGRISEVEINPLICTENAAIAADALIAQGTAI